MPRHFNEVQRPKTFEEYVGQKKAKERIQMCVTAATMRNEGLDHILLSGPPGLGKTTLAHLIAGAQGGNIHTTAGPNIERPSQVAGLLINVQPKDVVFIDEIHRLPKNVEETLYTAMEDRRIDVAVPDGTNTKLVQLHIEPFTLIGATTREGLLSHPLRTRFGIRERLEPYTPEDLTEITLRVARKLNLPLTEDAALEIGKRARGTARIALNLLRRVRDYGEVKCNGRLDKTCADSTLELHELDPDGLQEMDHRYLTTILNKFGGGPVGLNSLATALGEEAETLAEVHEPFLIQMGLVHRGHNGRILTELGQKRAQQNKKESN